MTIMSCPNEIPSISVYVVAAQSQDGIFAESTRLKPENKKNGLTQYGRVNDPRSQREKGNAMRCSMRNQDQPKS